MEFLKEIINPSPIVVKCETTKVNIFIDCEFCKQNFCWSGKEQEYYNKRKYKKPKKCKNCKNKKKKKPKRKLKEKLIIDELKNEQINCVSCKETFFWTPQQQLLYNDRSFSKPKRCKKCVQVRKERGTCFICYDSVKALKTECCNGKLCLKCWKDIEKRKQECPFCKQTLLRLEDKMEKIVNKMLN